MSERPHRPILVTQPFLPALDEYLPLLEQIWTSKMLTNGGPMHQRLEAELTHHLGVDQISLFNNGTNALIAALRVLDLTGEVITTPYSFVATTHSILWNGLTPVFVDIDPATFNIDPAHIEAAITPRTTAVMPVHCYGTPCDVVRIGDIAKRHGLKVLYDAAHAFGVKLNGQSVLRHGDLSMLSFHATKVFNTFEGGALVCGDPATKQRIDRLKNFGIVDEATIETVGLNGKLNEVQAAFGLVQLRHVDGVISRRLQADSCYRQLLDGIPGIEVPAVDPAVHRNGSYFPILVKPEFRASRDALAEQLRARQIHPRRYFYPLLSNLPMYRHLPSAAPGHLPHANRIARQVLCLPLHDALTESDIELISGIVRD